MKKFLLFVLILCAAGGLYYYLDCKNKAPEQIPEPKLSSIEQLKDQKLAAQRGTVGQMIAEDLLGGRSEELLTTFEKYVDAISALRQKKIRAIIMDEQPAKRFVKEIEGLAIMKQELANESYAIGFKKGNTDLVNKVNAALNEIKSDGTLDKIFDKYYNGDLKQINPDEIDFNLNADGGKLVVGTEAGFAPYELKVGDSYIGVDIEMCAAIAKKLNMSLVIENMNFDALPMAVNSGKVDMICAGFTVTEDRKKNMDFSENYVVNAKHVALVRADDYEQ